MRDEMFTPHNGDQPGVQNIGIVLTDGRSDDEQQTWQVKMRFPSENGQVAFSDVLIFTI